jgi:hypothetical protein
LALERTRGAPKVQVVDVCADIVMTEELSIVVLCSETLRVGFLVTQLVLLLQVDY